MGRPLGALWSASPEPRACHLAILRSTLARAASTGILMPRVASARERQLCDLLDLKAGVRGEAA